MTDTHIKTLESLVDSLAFRILPAADKEALQWAISEIERLRTPSPVSSSPAGVTGDALIALKTIAEWPVQEQDNMQAANMRGVAAAAVSALAGQSASAWQDIGELTERPDDVLRIDVRSVVTYRWLPYRPGSDQRRRGVTGRWQRATEYGWENAELPDCCEFRPLPAAPSPAEGE